MGCGEEGRGGEGSTGIQLSAFHCDSMYVISVFLYVCTYLHTYVQCVGWCVCVHVCMCRRGHIFHIRTVRT